MKGKTYCQWREPDQRARSRKGSTWPPRRIAVAGRITPGAASPLGSVLGQASQTSPAVWYIRQVAISVMSQRSVRKPAARKPRGKVIPS